MTILGISCFYHDSAAALIQDGRIVAAAEEERFTREKHDSDFPEEAIKFCLAEAGITSAELDYIGFYEKPMLKFERAMHTAKANFPYAQEAFEEGLPRLLHEELRIEEIISEHLDTDAEVLFLDHHLSHAASAFLCSPFEDAAVLTIDGVGEWATTCLGHGSGTDVELFQEIQYPHSLGLLYSAITSFLGFKVNNDEYKVMGLASYGEPTMVDEIRQLIEMHDDGSYALNMEYFSFHYSTERPYTEKLIELLGEPRVPESETDQRHMDIASSLQVVLEETLLKIFEYLRERTGSKNICLAGGVALNGVANWSVFKQSGFEEIFIQPASSDSGGALGAAAYIYHTALGNPRIEPMETALLGPEFTNDEVEEFLQESGAVYHRMDEEDLLEETAKLIHDGAVIGWFQGRMEYGPRALGSRSILANPCDPDMKDTLNARIKFREEFRPFAPAVIEEKASEYFEIDREAPFMLLVPQVKEGKGEEIPSVTHVDNSARVQTVSARANPRFHNLISAVGNVTGVPMVINTSFNVRGEPIVCTPSEAYNCFSHTDMDFLVMNDFLIEKGF
ncbi:MAG: carbamoyltransferase [Planctomycetota bacterium]|nr:carbamoyltransferase [Planctomycetota bacterium]